MLTAIVIVLAWIVAGILAAQLVGAWVDGGQR